MAPACTETTASQLLWLFRPRRPPSDAEQETRQPEHHDLAAAGLRIRVLVPPCHPFHARLTATVSCPRY